MKKPRRWRGRGGEAKTPSVRDALARSVKGDGFRAGFLTQDAPRANESRSAADLAFPTSRSVADEIRGAHYSGGTVGDFHPSSLSTHAGHPKDVASTLARCVRG